MIVIVFTFVDLLWDHRFQVSGSSRARGPTEHGSEKLRRELCRELCRSQLPCDVAIDKARDKAQDKVARPVPRREIITANWPRGCFAIDIDSGAIRPVCSFNAWHPSINRQGTLM